VNLVKQMLKVLVVGMVLISLAACTLFSNDGYHGGDHRSGGPTEPLRQ
jgi:ABC-type cobalt transport system substrate-binding protein